MLHQSTEYTYQSTLEYNYSGRINYNKFNTGEETITDTAEVYQCSGHSFKLRSRILLKK